MNKRFERINADETDADKKRHDAIRQSVRKEFPPKRYVATSVKDGGGIGELIREARMAQGLTWYAVAKKAGIPNSGTVRTIEQGGDAKLSNVEAVAKALGLRLTAVKS